MDGLVLAYLIGIYGLPVQPPALEPLALMVLPERVASSAWNSERNSETMLATDPPSENSKSDQLTERPVPPDPTTAAEEASLAAATATLSRASIADVVRAKADPIRHCYELGLIKDQHFSGTVEVGWRIQMDGRVQSVNIVGATNRNTAVEECLLAEITRWEFPPASEPTVVGVYPFVFDPSLLVRRATAHKTATSP